jgi:hypothetical protein
VRGQAPRDEKACCDANLATDDVNVLARFEKGCTR